MLWVSALLGWMIAFQDARPAADRRPDDALDVRQMFVPSGHVEKFRDPTSTYQTMRYDDFLDLLRSADAALKARRFVGPTSGSLSGRVDVDGRRVVGTSAWSFPKAHNGEVELRPWNLRVLAVRERGRVQRPEWGLTADGALVARGLSTNARLLDVDWELPGDDPDRRWVVRGQTPKCALSRIQLDYPADWRAWAPVSFETSELSPETRRLETRSSGEPSWTVELSPAGTLDAERPLLSWRGESLYRFGPVRTDVELRAVVQIDRERTPTVKLRLPAALDRLAPSTIGAAAQWRRTESTDGGVEWTAEFRRPPLGSVQIVASGSLPTPTAKSWPLESFSVPDALFRGERVEVVVDPALRLLNIDAAGLTRKDYGVDRGAGRWQFVGFAGAKRPSVHFDARRSEVEAQTQHFLDVGRERVRLAVRADWQCVRGELSTPTLLVPAGWALQKATVEPAERARAPASTESTEDGRLRVSLPLTRPLTTGERLRAIVQLERSSTGWTPVSGETTSVPEIVIPDAVAAGPAVYSIRLDPALPLRLTGDAPLWTISAAAAGAPPPLWNWDADVTRFRYAAPLTGATLRGIESRRSAFDVDVLHVVQERPSAWEVRTAFTVAVRSGEVGWVDVEASRPIPADARWSWNGVEESADDVHTTTSPKERQRRRYRIPLRASADGRTSIQVVWRTREPVAEPIAFRLPDADRTAVRAVVLSAGSARLEVASKGWAESVGESASGELFDPRRMQWSGRLERTDGAHSLIIRRSEASSNGERTGGELQGLVSVSGPRGRRVFRVSLQIDCVGASPLSLAVPADAKLWSATLDGQTTAAWLHSASDGRGKIDFAEPIPAGRHRLDLVFEGSLSPAEEAATPGVLEPWRAGRILWRISAADVAWRDLRETRLLGALVCRPPNESAPTLEQSAESVRRRRGEAAGFAAQRTARLLRTPPGAIGLDRAEDVADALLLLQRRLPDGWLLVVERAAADAARASRQLRFPPAMIDDWLASIGLHATLGDGVLLLTARPLAAAMESDGARVEAPEFAEVKADAIRDAGVEPWGAFVSASQWSASDEAFDEGGAPVAFTTTEESTILYVQGDGRPLDALPTRASVKSAASVIGFLLGAAAAVGAIMMQRHAATVAVAALAYLFAAVSESFGMALAGFAWGALAVAVLGVLVRLAIRLRMRPAALGLVVMAAATSGGSDERTALVPFDPDRVDGPLQTAEVPEPLLRRLRTLAEGRAASFLATSADYQGTVAGDHVDWTASLRLVMLAKEPPVKAALGLVGVDVQSVESDGKAVGFLAPAASLPLVATLPATPQQTLTIRFRTPIAETELGSMVEFPLPAAARQSFAIDGFSTPIDLLRVPESRGFSVRPSERGVRVVGARGPAALLQVVWRERTTPSRPASVAAAVALKPESKSGAWEMQTHFQWKADGKTELVLPIPSGVAIRRLEGPGLVVWKTEADAGGVRQLKATLGPGANGGALTVHSWFVPPDPENFAPPLLLPEKADLRGVAAITVGDEADLEVAAGRGVAELDAATFRDDWNRATNYPPPDDAGKMFAFSDEDHALAVLARPPSEPWRVAQEHTLSAAPHGRTAAWSAVFRFTAAEPTELAGFDVPSGFVVERVEADALFQWFRLGDRLSVRFSKPMDGTWSVRATGRFAFPETPDAAGSALLTPFFPAVGTAGTCTWSLEGEGGVGVELAREPPPSCRVQKSADELRVEGPAEDAALRIRLTRSPTKVFVRQAVLVRRRGDRWDCQGLVELRAEGRREAPWEILTPRSLGSIDWAAPGLRVIDAGVSEGFRRWLIEPRAVGDGESQRYSLRWSAAPLADEPDGPRVLDTPVPRMPAAAGHELWLAQFSTEGVEASAEGFTAERVPDWMQVLTAGFGGDQNLKVWRTNDPAHRITFTPPKEATPARRFKASGWMDVGVAKSGRCRGRAVWWLSAVDERLTVALPSGCQVHAVLVDGRSSAAVPSGGALVVRLDPTARLPRVELEWSAPGADLPALRDADVGSTLVRLRSPYGFQSDAGAVSRGAWLERMLERECGRWLARAADDRAGLPEDRIGLAFLYQTTREAAGAAPAGVEKIWSDFLDQVTTLRGEDVAQFLANVSAAAVDFAGPRLEPADAGAVIDHFDFAGAPALPAALDSPRLEPSRRRRTLTPWLFVASLAALGVLTWSLRRPPPARVE
jgi:hypothetical protein